MYFRRSWLAALALLVSVGAASAQSSPGFTNNLPLSATQLNTAFQSKTDYPIPTSAFTSAFGGAQGDILFNSATGWQVLAPGAAGTVLTSAGAGADLYWAAPNFAPDSLSGAAIEPGTLPGTALEAGTLALTALPNIGENTWLGNQTSATGAITANTWPSCAGNNAALIYTDGTGVGCDSAVANLSATDQTVSGGAHITPHSLGTPTSGATLQLDCGLGEHQYLTDNAAFTLEAPANDSHCLVLVEMGSSAGTITFSGFKVGANTGSPLVYTSGDDFTISVWEIEGIAGYSIFAHQ